MHTKLIFIFLYSIFLYSCINSNKKAREINGVLVVGNIVDDTLYNDTISFYSKSNLLLEKSVYKNGVLDGESIYYYANGCIKSKQNYTLGLKNGLNYLYDSLGRLKYIGRYYYGLPVGSISYFDENGSPKKYFFISFQNESLLEIEYSEWNGVKDIIGDCIRSYVDVQKNETTPLYSVFLYLMNPPRLKMEYSLYLSSKTGEVNISDLPGMNKMYTIEGDSEFVQLDLPFLSENDKYFIQLKIYDSILNKESVVYKELF